MVFYVTQVTVVLAAVAAGFGGGGGADYYWGQRPIKVLDAVRPVKRGGYGSGTGCAPPPPRPAHCWCRGATEGLRPQGQVSAPSVLPWPRLGLPLLLGD